MTDPTPQEDCQSKTTIFTDRKFNIFHLYDNSRLMSALLKYCRAEMNNVLYKFITSPLGMVSCWLAGKQIQNIDQHLQNYTKSWMTCWKPHRLRST